MYEYLFEEALKVNSNEHPLLLTELELTSLKSREKLTEVKILTLFIFQGNGEIILISF